MAAAARLAIQSFRLRVSTLELAHLSDETGQLSNLLTSSWDDTKNLISIKCMTVSPENCKSPGV